MSNDFYGRPTLPELLEAVGEWLQASSQEETPSGRWAFDARVAANIVAMAAREMVLGDEHRASHARRLAALGAADDATLAARVRAGVGADERAAILAAMRQAVDDRLAVCYPARLAGRERKVAE